MVRRVHVVGALLTASLVAAVAGGIALSARQQGHTPLHIGCKHHNHGPKWHADHGRSLDALKTLRAGRTAVPDEAELRRRSLTAIGGPRPGDRKMD
jgi:hypothetical protein